MKRVTCRYSAGACFAIASLLYLASCQSTTNVQPVKSARLDSTGTYHHLMADEGPNDPPKKPGGPGCCQ